MNSDFISGKDYQLTIPKETVSSFYAKNTQSKRFDFTVDKIEQFGSLEFTLSNAPASNYWIQLLDSSDKVVYQKYTKGDKVKFDILKPEEYVVRILVDNNNDKYWGEADFASETFAEDAYIFYKKALIKALWETREEWDLKDTRTLDNPKGTTAPTVPVTPPVSEEKEKAVIQQESKKELKSANAVITPIK